MTACLIIIGNEILSGRTQDANLPWIAQKLGEAGIRMMEARIVPDVEEEIVEAVNQCRAKHTYVFTTGGIGPTHDDITAACVARAFGCLSGATGRRSGACSRTTRPSGSTRSACRWPTCPKAPS